MSSPALEIELKSAPQLCYAMQQSAVPWLHQIALHNVGSEALRDLRVRIELPGFADGHVAHVAELPVGGRFAVPVPDLVLQARPFANLIERERADLLVAVECGDDTLARTVRAIDLLAYNEWPGLSVLPPLLAAFVAPNHPASTPLLHAVASRLEVATGSGALDGYQSGDAARVRAMLVAVHDVVSALGVRYVSAPPSFEHNGQKIRTPEQVVGDRLGTCLDLTLLYAALLEHIGVDPLVVLQREHAFVGVWLHAGSVAEAETGPAVELRKACAAGNMAVLECTTACLVPTTTAARASAAAEQRLQDDGAFVVALDVAACRRAGIRPLPTRTAIYAAAADEDLVGAGSAGTAIQPGSAPPPQFVVDEPVPLAASGPKDRLEHWQQKLLDLSMFNRLLNFVETKKTVRLAAHDLAALEDQLQSGGRMRMHARPRVGDQAQDPRDLQLRDQRIGDDLLRTYLAEELRAGRWRSELEQDELDTRLVEIFRHARTSLEESGANTLYLAVGFLRWFESTESQKPRRAPLLLLPIVIERLSVQEGYRFVLDDAEPRVNQTLLQLLQRDFDLRVPIGDSLPEDEHGVDVAAVLDLFRRATLPMARFEVEQTACVGFFSFTKFLMWRDLANRDELMQSAVLRHLVESPGAALSQQAREYARDELDDLEPSEVFCPKDADSSQLAAVLAGAGGRSFVLEGPPGTGKSQTITNLIAQSLANGKRVLFVAEKRAALEVVHDRLADVGLAPFCLELHSQKSGPKAVLDQLRQALELGRRRAPEQWQRVADELQLERTRLNAFVLALHRRREHGWSAYQAMVRLVNLRDAHRLPLAQLLQRPPADVAAAREAIENLVVAAGSLGVPSEATWWGVGRGDWTPAVTRDFEPLADRLQAAALALREELRSVVEALGLAPTFGEVGPSRAQLTAVLELVRALQAPSPPPSRLLLAANWRELDEDLVRAIAIGRRRDELWQQLAPRWRRDLLALDLGALAANYRLHAESFVLFRWLRLRQFQPTLAAAASGALGPAVQVRDDLERALRVRDEERELLGCRVAAVGLDAHWRDGHADWSAIDGWLHLVRQLRQLVLQLVPGSLQPDPAVLKAVAAQLDGLATGSSTLPTRCGSLLAAHDEFVAAGTQVQRHLDLDPVQAFGDDDATGHLARVGERTAAWLAEQPGLRDYCAYRRAALAARAVAVDVLVDAHAGGSVAVHELLPAFERSLHEGWLDLVHQREPELARFRGQAHEAAIARFAELDRQTIQLAAKVVVARLAARLPRLLDTQVASSELGILERELKKQRRHKPVRRLLGEIRGLWPRISPCVLMSPLSVAQFLGRDAQRFDLVVFDEASQIPMWDAVGAIGRGESLIVVGDSRQLPPTSFFQRMAEGDEPDVDGMPEDLESVLDECGAAGLPRLHLDWHYRSRHESLIAFSNHHYYQNRLLTFPAPRPAGDGFGVSCVRVDGVYDRAGSQQNRIEAEALVAAVVERLRDPQLVRRSIGIVTFSKAQQTLIEDLLDAERRADPSLEAALAAADEELFVKNLENVQGDERDVILFSICYGPDAAGKIYENYGPLNLQGGERRLNVAVTRARRELIVFTSVGPEQVANRTAAVGARHLRNFLDYAQRGESALVGVIDRDPSRDVDSPFEAAVRDALVQRGYEVHTQVGCSGYRIDLAVVDPSCEGRYLLGIECDGATYHRAATARDRDRLRASVLRGLGWRLSRVWSTDFWQDPTGEIDRLEGSIEAAKVDLASAVQPTIAAEPLAAVADDSEAVPAIVDRAADDERGEGHGPLAAAEPFAEASPDRAVAAPLQPPAGEAAAIDPIAEPVADPAGEVPLHEVRLHEEPATDVDGPRPYRPAQLTRDVEDHQAAAELLAAEAPIAFDRFARRLAETWAIGRVTNRVRERVRAAVPAAAVEHEGVLWCDPQQRLTFRGFRVPGEDAASARSAEDLPGIEVAHAMLWLLRHHHAISRDDLAREAARCFGIQRLGNIVREVMARGVERVIAAGLAVRDSDTVRLPD